MAIWQFECNIVPLRDNVNGDNIIPWKDVKQPQVDIAFLEREKSWSQNIIQYGKLDETCIEFIFDKDVLEEISCRLDLRSLKRSTLILLLEYVQEIEAMFLVENVLYPPNIEIILEIMKHSKANQYCKDPLGFIGSFSEIE